MGRIRWYACALLLLCPLALTRHDDDFAFDNSDEFQVELTANHSEITKNGLTRLWGVPDATAYVGHLFRMEIPKEAFTGEVVSYKVRSEEGSRTPSWLAVDSKHGLISGVPLHHDLGPHGLTVTAHGKTVGLTARDSFTVEVKKAEEKPHSKYGTCGANENRLVLTVLVDAAFSRISSRQRIKSLMDLANFMALDGDEFWIEPYKVETVKDQTILMSGPGTTLRKKGDSTTAIFLNVGCGEKLWSRHKVLVAGLREQSRDGTLAHLLRMPVLGWRLVAARPAPRSKRQLDPSPEEGSGGYDYDNVDEDDDDYSGFDDDDDDYPIEAPGNVDVLTPMPHPHRHHHGEDGARTTETTTPLTTTDPTTDPPTTPTPTTTTTTLPTTTETQTETEEYTSIPEPSTNAITTEDRRNKDSGVKIEPIPESVSEGSNINISRIAVPRQHSPVLIVPETDAPTTTEEAQTVIIRASNELPSSTEEVTVASPSPPPTEPSTETSSTSTSTSTTTPASPPTPAATTVPTPVATTTPPPPTQTTYIPETTIQEVTTQESVRSTERTSTIVGRTTETVMMPLPVNQPPTLNHHMKKLVATAGKAFRYIIPADLFTDPEEGGNLTFTMQEAEGAPLAASSWIQFYPPDREVYGLPLESHVSRWNFIVEARDSSGAAARGPLDITVQQYKGRRTVNHHFTLRFKLNKQYNHDIDWQIRALEGIVNLFRDTDMDHLTVLNATKTGEICEFVWTNDTLPKDVCPTEDIERLMKILESDTEKGSPSPGLARAMSPELKISSVSWTAEGCARGEVTKAPDTYPPVTRNQVDHLTATVGHLLIYKVPEDTFFDPEDGGTRSLSLSLRYSDRSPLPPGHWLQFDANNQEFYGLPATTDEGSLQYQLVAEDSSKKSAYDSLIVEVVKAPAIRPTVEFQMTLDHPYPALAYSAIAKRKVVEKLATFFGQTDSDNIRIHTITDNPTTIIWYNTSLPMDRCPQREIEELRRQIVAEERGGGGALSDSFDAVFDQEYKVMSITLLPLGLCAEPVSKAPKTPSPGSRPEPGSGAGSTTAAAGYTEYLVTFVIPAVVVAAMLLVAGVVACALYRRRRTGKMSVGDEEERQAFRSKGIPVIFQDELEEQAATEPLHKSPVIMREEKPPLLPPAPDYRSSAPYRPPPPVAPAASPPRHKTTPTYRKPPPYVPP